MFALQNLNLLLNNVPQMSVLAKYSIFPSSSLPVKKLPELDAVCCELAQAVQLVKDIKNEKFLDYLTNMKHEVEAKAFEWLYFEDPSVKLIKENKRTNFNVGLHNKNETVSTVAFSSNSNNKIANDKKCVSPENNFPDGIVNNIDLFEESKLNDSINVIVKNKKALSVASHFISLKNMSSQNMYKNGFLYKTPAGGLQFNVNWMNFQGQKRYFKTKRQIQMELDTSFLGVLRKLTEVFAEKKHDNSNLLKKEPSMSESADNLQTSNQKNAPSGSFNFRNTSAVISFFTNMVRLAFWCAAILVFSEVYKSAYSSDKFALNHIPETVTVTFDDAKGMDEAKAELKCVVEFLRDPSKFMYLGGKLPSGILLQGPPGTGKTLLARAVAGEANVQFFHISGSEFDELLVGEGARRVRNIFNAARKRAPAVIFIDEIDAVGGRRVSTSMHPFANQTIIQLLAEMDGFVQNDKIIVIGATNRESDLDEALLRPGRFDLKIQLFRPDVKGRKEILQVHLNKIVSKGIDVDFIAKRTSGFSGADIENLVNQAALSAATEGCEYVTTEHMERALEKVTIGPAKKSMVLTEETKKITAYHESGHATVAHFTPGAEPLVKATIVPHGHSLGHVSQLKEDKYTFSKSEILASIDVRMGGRAAEELIFGSDKVTTGCESDLDLATRLATNMILRWGMSDKVGPRTLRKHSCRGYNTKEWGEATGDEIDLEIKKILQESYERAKKILKKHAKEHKLLAEKLLENETIDGDEIKEIFGQGKDEEGSGKDEV